MAIPTALRAAACTALVALTLPARAQDCSTFTDVLQSNPACNAIQWVKNRAITLGCTSLTTFCPVDNVSRAQMALFLERLGRAQTPVQIFATSGGAAIPTLDQTNPFRQVCISQTLPAADFPRSARIRGNLSLTASGDTPLSMFLIHDDNPPGPWINANNVALLVPFPAADGYQSLSWSSEIVPIAAGITYRFAIGLALQSGSMGTITGTGPYQCQVDVLVFNANGSAPPY